jgi:hypothetical protein
MSPVNPGMDVANPGYKDVQTPRIRRRHPVLAGGIHAAPMLRIHANWMPATRSVGATGNAKRRSNKDVAGQRRMRAFWSPAHPGMDVSNPCRHDDYLCNGYFDTTP